MLVTCWTVKNLSYFITKIKIYHIYSRELSSESIRPEWGGGGGGIRNKVDHQGMFNSDPLTLSQTLYRSGPLFMKAKQTIIPFIRFLQASNIIHSLMFFFRRKVQVSYLRCHVCQLNFCSFATLSYCLDLITIFNCSLLLRPLKIIKR